MRLIDWLLYLTHWHTTRVLHKSYSIPLSAPPCSFLICSFIRKLITLIFIQIEINTCLPSIDSVGLMFSETEGLGFLKNCASTVFECVLWVDSLLVLGKLLAVVDFPGVVTATSHRCFLSLQFCFVHLLHHFVLSTSGNGCENVWHSFNQHNNESADKSLFESLLHTSADLQHSASHETSNNGVPWVVFLSVVDKHAVKSREKSSPETEWASEERSTVPHQTQTTPYSLATRGIYHS